MVLRFCSLVFAVFAIWQVSPAQNAIHVPPEQPGLIVGIVIDQMRYDYISRYWNRFGEGGFRRLIDEGTFCRNAQYLYLNTQSGPGYTTIATGTMPSAHGIVADEWYRRLQNEKLYCTFDPSVLPVGGSYDNGRHSPANIIGSTFADEMRLHFNMRSKVYGVGMKEHSAILSAGHSANASYWYDGNTGTWMSSTHYIDSLPLWVKEFNGKNFPDIYLDRVWETLFPRETYVASLADSNHFEKGFGNQHAFPYDLNKISKRGRRQRDYGVLGSTPFGNTFTKDFAIGLIVNEGLGKDQWPDFLSLCFTASAEVGRMFGPFSMEMEDIYLRLDRDIEHFLQFLDQQLGKKNVLIYLTSNHGVSVNPAYLESLRIPGGFFNLNGSVALLRSYLNAVYGSGNWVETVLDQQIFLNRNLIEDARISLEEIQNRVARFMVQLTGVSHTVTSSTLETVNFTDGIFHKIQNGFHQKRSGDVMFLLEPGWVVRTGNVTGHGSAYRSDSHVPLIWYGWKIRRATLNQPVEMTGVAPTISYFLNMAYPNGSTGQPIPGLINQ